MKTPGKIVALMGACLALHACDHLSLCNVESSKEDLSFTKLASIWDEAIPLGNAEVGALVWQKDSSLRLSLDRTDLWDLRPADSLSGPEFRFEWVKEHIRNKNYTPVQKKFDEPYDVLPAPSKIPGAALEFPIQQLGKPDSVHLYLNNALCEVKWANGTVMQTFVHANQPLGWFVFKNVGEDFEPRLVAPQYNSGERGKAVAQAGPELDRLGYTQGEIVRNGNSLVYHQKGYKDYYYDVAVNWERSGKDLYGTWSVTSSLSADKAVEEVAAAMGRGMAKDYADHMQFWNAYWSESSVSVPDPILQKQYQNEMYKYGSATRENSRPISLQAVWTADNGYLPPWKGDYHHDLNTQLSYWPTYTGNHLTEGLGYLNTLWNQRDVYKHYTRQYFEVDGMNVPGVATLDGEPMGGWIQYAMSQTVGAWLAQHFYLHWKYSMDRDFLKNRAYPFIKDVAIFLENISKVDKNGVRTLEFSSSPEIFDNTIQAWFPGNMTNYDLALMKFLFNAASELAGELNLTEEAEHWKTIWGQLPALAIDKDGSLAFAKGVPYKESHRHFSHAMSFHPLGLIDWSDGEESQRIIKATLKKLEDVGPDWWCGYSYSWIGNMYARAFDGEKAVEALKTFATCFCLPNTFHANGDQTKSGKSRFTYRPFTLEGNFAFASGIQEMLLQSHTGIIRVFPAIPASWKDVSFTDLRAMGAFLVSATMKDGKLVKLTLRSEKGGEAQLLNPVTGKVEKYVLNPGETKEII